MAAQPVEGVGNLEIHDSLSHGVQVGAVLFFYSQMIKRANDVEQVRSGEAEQRAEVKANGPLPFRRRLALRQAACGGRNVTVAECPSQQSASIFCLTLKPILPVAAENLAARIRAHAKFLFVFCRLGSISLQASSLPESLIFVGPGEIPSPDPARTRGELEGLASRRANHESRARARWDSIQELHAWSSMTASRPLRQYGGYGLLDVL